MKNGNSKRDTLKKLAAGMGVMSLGRAGLSFAQQEPLKIACIFPLSGPLAQPGNATLAGAKIAAEQFNRAGGVLGRKIELVIRDDKANPAEAALVGREILGSGIKFIVGGLLTAPAMAIASMLGEHNALMTMSSSTVMAMTHENFNPNTFRINFNSRMNQYAAAQAMAQNYPKITKWGGIVPDNQFGNDNYRIFSNALKKAYQEKAGATIETLSPVLTPFPASDFRVQIARLMSSPVEGLYTGMIGADYFTFMAQAKQMGLYAKVKVFMDSGQGIAVAKGLGANLPKSDTWTMTPWYSGKKDSNATSKALVKDYFDLTKDANPDASVHLGHAAMLAMLNGIKAAKSVEVPVVRVAIERIEFEAANGPFRFRREDHQAVQNIELLRFVQKTEAPGWGVDKVVTINGEKVIEPASPGKPYIEP